MENLTRNYFSFPKDDYNKYNNPIPIPNPQSPI